MEFLTAFFNWIGTLPAHLTTEFLGQVLSLGVLASIGIAMYNIHTNKSNNIDLADLFMDRTTGRINGSKFRMILAFAVTSWVIVYATLHGNISEWMFAGYIGAWVADRKFSRDSSKVTTSDTASAS